MADYVNAPTEQRKSPERRGHCHPGESKVFLVVGVSFGLLCIIQATVNICLRLQGTESDHINCTNNTIMAPANISKLLRDRDLLIRELKIFDANEKWLNRRLSEEQNRIIELQAEIKRLESQPGCCPRGWRSYMSSCYHLSTERKNWRDAEADCESNGAGLVVINDELEAKILRQFGDAIMWIGLRAQSSPQHIWLWEDRRIITLEDQHKFRWQPTLDREREGEPTPQTIRTAKPGDPRFSCAYAVELLSEGLVYAPADCADQHQWLCEMRVM